MLNITLACSTLVRHDQQYSSPRLFSASRGAPYGPLGGPLRIGRTGKDGEGWKGWKGWKGWERIGKDGKGWKG